MRRLNPYAEHMYDGIDLSPFEILFVKLKEFLLEANWTTAAQGKKYSQWSLDRVSLGRVAQPCSPTLPPHGWPGRASMGCCCCK
jgi:hypothetical protein